MLPTINTFGWVPEFARCFVREPTGSVNGRPPLAVLADDVGALYLPGVTKMPRI